MNRRDFLGLSTKLTASLALPASLVGCGGGSGDAADLAPNAATSSIDSNLATTSALQSDADSTSADLDQSLNDTLVASPVAAAPASLIKATTSSVSRPQLTEEQANNLTEEEKNSYLVDFFQKSTSKPMYTPVTPLDGETYLTSHYLENAGSGTLWENAVSAQQLAYKQYTHQYTKLVATMRLFDAENYSATDAQAASARTVTPRAVVQASARDLLNATPKSLDLLDILNGLITSVVSGVYGLIFDSIGSALQEIYSVLLELIGSDQLQGLAYSFLVTASVDDMLQALIEANTENLNFENRTEVTLSLAKISIAAVALLSLTKMNGLEDAEASSIDTEFMTAYVSSTNVISNVSLMWLGLSDNIMTDVLGGLQANASAAIDIENDGADYGLEVLPDSSELIATLKTNSTLLALVSLAIKSVFSVMESETADIVTGDSLTSAFTADSAADIFKILFTSEPSVADEVLATALDADSFTVPLAATVSSLTESVTGDAEFVATVDDWSSDPISERLVIVDAGLAVEEDAYDFALELANFAYEFTMQTEGDAVEFATHLADLAYQFTMDIETDAYNFAMQGMEYGYLFASRGEEVGIMADRILWMAVQIGIMADRIGEMADRIVYTEQLIVYTEILILDFGLLIYGTIKQITNLILTGMALILDREWYTPESEDLVLNAISSNVNVMIENMQEYALAVLDNQGTLRELTMDSLVAYAEYPEPEVV